MSVERIEAITKIISDLEEIDISQYPKLYMDGILEVVGEIDNQITGQLNTLIQYCNILGWSELSNSLVTFLPLNGNAVEAIEMTKGYVIPEIRRLLKKFDVESECIPIDWFWEFLHPRICSLAKPRFNSGYFSDAVESSFKEINNVIKKLHLSKTKIEMDGANLMTSAFSLSNPSISLNELSNESEKNSQKGYLQIFAGSMTGIRNPVAHANQSITSKEALHLICLASLLMHKIDGSTAFLMDKHPTHHKRTKSHF